MSHTFFSHYFDIIIRLNIIYLVKDEVLALPIYDTHPNLLMLTDLLKMLVCLLPPWQHTTQCSSQIYNYDYFPITILINILF